jgi:hypothetical protein
MNSKNANLFLLLGLSFLWFFLGIGITVVFSFALGSYGNSGEQTTPMMMVSLVSLVALPMICVHTLVLGWRCFMVANYPAILKVALLPFPLLILVVIIFRYAWP